MRVAVITPLYPPHSRVGAWLATHELLGGLVGRGHQVVVVPFVMGVEKPYEFEGIRVLASGSRDVAIRQSDLVISHLGDGGSNHKLALQHGKPSVRMVHGSFIQRVDMEGSALLVCNSQATLKAVSRFGGEKVIVHPPTFPERFRTNPGSMVTLVNLATEKGGEVFWRIAERMPGQQFLGVLGGYGSQVRGRASNVTVIGQTDNMRDKVYARTKLLLMPSRAESWGMVAQEAACSGIPTLACPTDGLLESLGDAGNWQKGFSAGMWTPRVRTLLQPEPWREASGRALAMANSLDPAGEIARFADAIEGVLS